ncbi:MAG: ABC transporter substrate-binding protein [Rhodothermales bacterium]
MPRAPTYFTALTLLALFVVGCGDPAEPRSQNLTDDLGRSVAVELPVSRVATLAPSLTEIVFAVGGGDRLVGVGIPDDYPPAVATIPRFSTYPVDFEALTALEPDLVLASTQVNSPRSAETLEAVGIPTYFLSISSLDDVYESLQTVGRMMNHSARADVVADSLRNRTAILRQATAPVDRRPSVLVLVGIEALYSFGKPSYVHELVDLAGGRSITRELETAAPVLSEEFVLTRAPDVIVGLWGDAVNVDDVLDRHPAWTNVPAVRNGRVYGVDADLLARPGPRLVAGAYALARLLHPDLFPLSTSPSD